MLCDELTQCHGATSTRWLLHRQRCAMFTVRSQGAVSSTPWSVIDAVGDLVLARSSVGEIQIWRWEGNEQIIRAMAR